MLCATLHWKWTTLRRLGRTEAAEQALHPVHAGMPIIENEGYHRLLLMYKGELSAADVLGRPQDGVGSATVAFGIANWHFVNGRAVDHAVLVNHILASSARYAFGYIAAEADAFR